MSQKERIRNLDLYQIKKFYTEFQKKLHTFIFVYWSMTLAKTNF